MKQAIFKPGDLIEDIRDRRFLFLLIDISENSGLYRYITFKLDDKNYEFTSYYDFDSRLDRYRKV